jgi:outer membrane autotransporter protein
VGAALNLGGGYAQSYGDFNKTKNSFQFWGAGLYGGWTQHNFGLTADVGYTGTYNNLRQVVPASMQMGELKADVNSHAITAGLRAEYKLKTDVLDIIPHAAARYASLIIDRYDVKRDGTVFRVDQSQQNIWTFPAGIAFSKDINTGKCWMFKPHLDVAVIPATGDLRTKSRSRIPGVGSAASLETQVVDYLTWQGGAGFELKSDDLSLGLNYNIQISEHRTGHGVFGSLRYDF